MAIDTTSNTRLEAFSDGVFAIAVTLLVLDLRVPTSTGKPLLAQLLAEWPALAGFGVSFLTIGVIWINHHQMLEQIGRADRTMMLLNLLFLMCVSFIPFPTAVVAQHITGTGSDQLVAALFYGGTLIVLAILFQVLWQYIKRKPLLHGNVSPAEVEAIDRNYRPGIPLYVVGTLTAFVSAYLAVALFAAFAAFYAVATARFRADR